MLISNVKPIEPQRNDEIARLFNNIDLIIRHKQQIMARAEYKNIRVKGTGIDGLFIGHLPLFLGDLVTLWEASPWRTQNKFYYHLGGSPLSGMSFCTYWTPDGVVRMPSQVGWHARSPAATYLCMSSVSHRRAFGSFPSYGIGRRW